MKCTDPGIHFLSRLLALSLSGWVTLALSAAVPDSAPEPPRPEAPLELRSRDEPRYVGELVNVFNNSKLSADQRAERVITVFGDTDVAGEVDDVSVTVMGNTRVSGRVRNACVTVFGHLDLNGEVGGDLVVIMGDARLGPEAVVSGETVVIGGQLETKPGATLHGQKIHLAGFLKGLGDWFRYGLLLGRPLPPGVGWVWWIVAVHFLFYLLVAALLPRPVEACQRTLDKQALTAFGVGLLGLILVAPLSFVLLASGVGLLVLPIVLVSLKVALLVGKAGTFQWLGRNLCARFNVTSTCPPLVGLVAGFLVITLLYMVPGVGFVVFGLLIPLAFGAALLALVEAVRAGRASVLPTSPTPPVTPGPGADAVAPAAVAPFAMPVVRGLSTSPDTGAQAAAPALAAPSVTSAPAPRADGPIAAPPPVPPLPPPPPESGMLVRALSPAELASLPRAGFWIRTGAAALDVLLLAWLIAPLPGSVLGPFFVLALIAYHTLFWAWKGTTLGGIVCGLKVVRADGRAVDRSVALVRALAAVFSALPLFLGFFWAGWSAERRSWHDLIAGTLIVKMPRGEPLI